MEYEADARRRLPEDVEHGEFAASDGWRIRTLRLRPAVKAKGAILFAGGRADFIEKYVESLVHWRRRGWDVTSFDWRGQGGSGRFADDPHVGHAEDFATWLDDLAGLSAQWRAAVAGPHMLIGHSMGGHLMLRHVAGQAPDVAGLVLSSPMIGFRTPLPEAIVRRIALAKVRTGQAAMHAWGQKTRLALADPIRQRRLTGDKARYADELWWFEQQPELLLGGASWGWIEAAYRSTDLLTAPGVMESIRVPVLLAATKGDRVVNTQRAIAAVKRIPRHEIALFPGGHELLRERDDIRKAMWDRIDRFMEEHRRC